MLLLNFTLSYPQENGSRVYPETFKSIQTLTRTAYEGLVSYAKSHKLRELPEGTNINAANFERHVVPGVSVILVGPLGKDYWAVIGTVRKVSGDRHSDVVVEVAGKDYQIKGWTIHRVLTEGGFLGAYRF